jgi:methylmalonyl-CoA mutase cobalamin-binding subunit
VRPVAVVGTLEGNHHQLGALCIRLLLERSGWQVFYPGADVPVEDFGVIQMSRDASLVCISLPPAGSLGDVDRSLGVLRHYYDRARPSSVVFGGPSLTLEGVIDEGPFEEIVFMQQCTAMREALERGLGSSGKRT